MATSEQLSSTPLQENIDEDNPDLVVPIVSPRETEIAENEEEVNPFEKKKRRKTSHVWDEFKEVKSTDGKTIIGYGCIHCNTRLTKVKSGATTHFIRHLKGCTIRQIKLRGQKQLSVTTTAGISESVNTVQNFVYDYAKCHLRRCISESRRSGT